MTCELKRLHPQDAGSPETGEARLQAALDAAVVDLGGAQQYAPLTHPFLSQTHMSTLLFSKNNDVLKYHHHHRKIRDLQGLNESQEALLDRRTSEYEALLESRRAEVETMHILSHSLDETQARHDEAQEDLAKMQVYHHHLFLCVCNGGPFIFHGVAEWGAKNVQEELNHSSHTISNFADRGD